MAVIEKLKERFGFLDVRHFIEQVASAPTQDVQAMMRTIGCRLTELVDSNCIRGSGGGHVRERRSWAFRVTTRCPL